MNDDVAKDVAAKDKDKDKDKEKDKDVAAKDVVSKDVGVAEDIIAKEPFTKDRIPSDSNRAMRLELKGQMVFIQVR